MIRLCAFSDEYGKSLDAQKKQVEQKQKSQAQKNSKKEDKKEEKKDEYGLSKSDIEKERKNIENAHNQQKEKEHSR